MLYEVNQMCIRDRYSGQDVRVRIVTHHVDNGVSDQLACAGLFHSGCNGKHTGEQEDCYPVNTLSLINI